MQCQSCIELVARCKKLENDIDRRHKKGLAADAFIKDNVRYYEEKVRDLNAQLAVYRTALEDEKKLRIDANNFAAEQYRASPSDVIKAQKRRIEQLELENITLRSQQCAASEWTSSHAGWPCNECHERLLNELGLKLADDDTTTIDNV
jgi:hypothetical protein